MVVFLPSFTYIGAGVSLCIGGAISGWSRKKNGGEFWEGFADYINENWSQTVAILEIRLFARAYLKTELRTTRKSS